jgi:hypothetical protein
MRLQVIRVPTTAAHIAVLGGIFLIPNLVKAEDAATFGLRDRGSGVPASPTGIYLDPGEWLGVTSYLDVENRGFQYAPDELGFAGGEDYLGDYRFNGGTFFIGYGISPSLSVGLKVTGGSAKLTKASDDPSAMPAEIKESGLGDIAPELAWRFMDETARRPELFAYVSVLIPHDSDKKLIGTEDLVVDEVWQTTFIQWRASQHVTVPFGSRIGLTTMTEGWSGELGFVVRQD